MAINSAIFEGDGLEEISNIEDRLGELSEQLNPFSEESQQVGQVPFYYTGARALLRVAGKPVGVANRVRWSVGYTSTPIHTIDSSHAWDIDVGAARVTAEIGQIIDPTRGLENQALFHIMQAAIHQPHVEMQLLDRGLGTQIFFARGMFTAINGDVATQSMGSWTAKFVGVAYQHYVTQNFQAYNSVGGKVSGFLDDLQNVASDFTGGIL